MKHAIFVVLAFFVVSEALAGAPLWTFTPLTSTTVSVPSNGSATVQYLITNQSTKTHALAMLPITGVTQATNGSGVCGNPFTLSGHASCTLSLQIDGSQVQAGSTNGPILCQQGSSLECYRPSALAVLTLDVTDNLLTVGGMVLGLSETLVLLNNDGDPNAITSNGPFTFAAPALQGSSYNVTVGTQPLCQTCVVTNGSGTVGSSNITNVSVSCSPMLIQGC
jgi:hypothetical protein